MYKFVPGIQINNYSATYILYIAVSMINVTR